MFRSIYDHLQLKMYYLQLKMIVDRSKHVLFLDPVYMDWGTPV